MKPTDEFIPHGFDTENGVRVSNFKISYIQDCDERSGSIQELDIEIQDGGGGYYYVLKTERWAIDNFDELIKILEDFKKRFG
jgi:hypothetical protein